MDLETCGVEVCRSLPQELLKSDSKRLGMDVWMLQDSMSKNQGRTYKDVNKRRC